MAHLYHTPSFVGSDVFAEEGENDCKNHYWWVTAETSVLYTQQGSCAEVYTEDVTAQVKTCETTSQLGEGR